MPRYSITVISLLFAVGCGDGSSRPDAIPDDVQTLDLQPADSVEPVRTPTEVVELQELTEKEVAICKFVASHLRELEEIKVKEDFRLYGFGSGGPYSRWLKEVEQMRAEQPKGAGVLDPSLEIRISLGDLLQIGMDYVTSKGLGTNYTRTIVPQLKATIRYSEFSG